eukprot:358394-Chlamydomonas_euryale.AAC.1
MPGAHAAGALVGKAREDVRDTDTNWSGGDGSGGGGGGDAALEGAVTLAGVVPNATVLATKTRPKRVVLLGSDGSRRAFLLKGRDDLRADERLMQVWGRTMWWCRRVGGWCGAWEGQLLMGWPAAYGVSWKPGGRWNVGMQAGMGCPGSQREDGM